MKIGVVAIVAIAVQSVAAQPPDHVARGQAMLAHVIAGEFDKVEEYFTPQMQAALPAGRLAAAWSGLLAHAGPLKTCETEARVAAIGDKHMVIRSCTFERAKLDVQFAFDRAGKISGLTFRPAASGTGYAVPPYAKASAYVESAVTIGSGEWTLPGVLTLPVGDTPVPAVVLVHGSGPADRDATFGPNKPFKDLALGLSSRGVAVLRYDKRTKAHPAKVARSTQFTVRDEVIDDVVEAVKVLGAQPRVDASRIFIAGHSLGGMLIPRIAAANPSIAGFIVLAGAARPLEDAIVAQARYLMSGDGHITPEEQRVIDEAVQLAASVRALQTADAASGRMLSGAPASYWLDLRGYDPPEAAKAIKAPMLILQGERDYQVTVEEFDRWKAALGSRRDVTFRSYPTLNHLFIAGEGRSMPAEYQTPGHVAEDVVRDIAAWILAVRPQ